MSIRELQEEAACVCLSATTSDIKRTVEACLKKQIAYEQIANYEKHIKLMNSEWTKDFLLLLMKDLANGSGNLWKLFEQRGRLAAGMTNMSNEFSAEEMEMGEINNVFLDETGDVATFRSNIFSEVDELIMCLKKAKQTITSYEQMLRDRDQVVENMKIEMKVLNEQIVKQELDIRDLHVLAEGQRIKLSCAMTSAEAKEKELSNLYKLLDLADEKLDERLDQMEKMTSSVDQLTQHVVNAQVNEINQMEVVRVAVESVQTTLSMWTDVREHIKQVSTRKTNAESAVMKTDIPDYLKRLQLLYPRLTEKLSASAVAPVLFQKDVLKLGELQKIQCSCTAVGAAEYLLTLLLDLRCKVTYDCFLNALKATNQVHIYLWLTYDDYNIDGEHADLIRQKYTFLLEHLNLKDSGLIASVYQEQVIDQREKEFLESGEGAVKQAERFLSVLSRKSLKQFERFLDALEQTGQGHVADELRRLPLEPSAQGACAVEDKRGVTISKKKRHHYVIDELLTTEQRYVEMLELLINQFMKPLQCVLDSDIHKQLFFGIEDLYRIHKSFCDELWTAASACSSSSVPQCFVNFKDQFVLYGEYCARLRLAQNCLVVLSEDDRVAVKVKECQNRAFDSSLRFTLSDTLAIPMQRVLKYQLLLKELVRSTDYDHEDRDLSNQALVEMEDLLLFTNEMGKDANMVEVIVMIEKSIKGLKLPSGTRLQDYGRMLMDREFDVRCDNKTPSRRYVYVFDKLILFCKPKQAKEKYQCKGFIFIGEYEVDTEIVKDKTMGHSFSMTKVGSADSKLTFGSSSAELAVKLIEAITMAKDNVRPRGAQTATHDFELVAFDKPQYCAVCNKLIRGVFFQGYRCKKTEMAVHKDCISQVTPTLTAVRPAIDVTSAAVTNMSPATPAATTSSESWRT